ncbi:MAG: TetR/AcrR family transcriptional regulator [Pseudomonadaceae bacterium]|nr:TetR/AcrR family transcriptional regulator [Pseudomonadaceae bacterium]
MTETQPDELSQRERNKARSRRAIVEAAGRLIKRHGFDATTARQIANEAGVSYQTLYNYFPSKAQIVEALLTSDIEQTKVAGEVLVDTYAGDLNNSLGEYVKLQIDTVAHRDRELWRQVTLDVLRHDPAHNRLFERIYNTAHDGLTRLLLSAREAGELSRNVDIELLAHTIYALTDFGMLNYLLNPTLSKVELLQALRAQLNLVVTPYLADGGRLER